MKPSRSVLAFSALWALAPLAVAQHAAAPVDLGTLGGNASVANGVATFGTSDTTVGGAEVFTNAYQHATYTNAEGYLEDLESLIGVYGNSVANGIGSVGTITGTSDQIVDSEGDIASHAFYFSNWRTGMVDPGTNGGTLAEGNATQNGTVVGASTIAGDVAYVAFHWTPTHGMVSLNTLSGNNGTDGLNSYAFGMSATGAAVGNSDALDGNTNAVLWNLNTLAIRNLGTLGGSFAQLNAVNDSYFMVGYSYLSGDAQADAVIVSSNAGLVDIGNLGESYAQANAVNDSGVVVGFSNTTGDAAVHAFIWTQSGGMVDLNTLLPSNSPFTTLISANAIAADGTIVGIGLNTSGQYDAFAW